MGHFLSSLRRFMDFFYQETHVYMFWQVFSVSSLMVSWSFSFLAISFWLLNFLKWSLNAHLFFSTSICFFLSFPFDPFETFFLLSYWVSSTEFWNPKVSFFLLIFLYNTIHILFELTSLIFKYVNNILC